MFVGIQINIEKPKILCKNNNLFYLIGYMDNK